MLGSRAPYKERAPSAFALPYRRTPSASHHSPARVTLGSHPICSRSHASPILAPPCLSRSTANKSRAKAVVAPFILAFSYCASFPHTPVHRLPPNALAPVCPSITHLLHSPFWPWLFPKPVRHHQERRRPCAHPMMPSPAQVCSARNRPPPHPSLVKFNHHDASPWQVRYKTERPRRPLSFPPLPKAYRALNHQEFGEQ
jgi:hypothetical protein